MGTSLATGGMMGGMTQVGFGGGYMPTSGEYKSFCI
jgi:hypothetical protein